MGAIGGLLGIGGGAGGTGFSKSTNADITNPTNSGQIGSSYAGTQNSMGQQQALLGALQGQNGIGNQSQVYGQLQGVANGTGPNPAQAMLNQQTGTNVANQAALMAGQRGASSNVGLMARQAAQQGAAIQQQAVGQGATMQANQSLNALGQAGAMANNQASNQIGQTNANTSAQQNEQQSLLNAQQGVNNARVGSQSSVNAGNTALASTTMQGQHGLLGGVMNGIGAMFAGGGDVAAPTLAPQAPSGPMSKFGQFMQKKVQNDLAPKATPVADPTGDIALQNGAEALVTALGRSKTAPAQPQLAGGQDAAAFSSPDLMVAANGGMAATGGNVEAKPGQQAVKSGNSYDNDKIPAVLSEGEIVIPRSVSMGKDPVKGSAAFVAQVLAKRQAKG